MSIFILGHIFQFFKFCGPWSSHGKFELKKRQTDKPNIYIYINRSLQISTIKPLQTNTRLKLS